MSIIATISIVCHNQKEITKICLDYLKKNTPSDGVELILSDNCSSDGTYELLQEFQFPNKEVVGYTENLGYQVPNNEALARARGRFFIVLNNDIYIKSSDWLEKMLDPLVEDEEIALVGVKGSPCSLSKDANGFVGPNVEYIEGSCMVGRTDLLREYGLFSPALKFAYYDDSDLSLRYRQMGYKLHQVEIDFEHVRGVTTNSVDKSLILSAREHNEKVFFSRWEAYIRNRKFSNKILAICNSDGIGDIIALTPIFEGLRYDHPKAEIILHTNHPEVFQYNEFIDSIVDLDSAKKKKYDFTFDRVVELTPPFNHKFALNYASYTPICEMGEKNVNTRVRSYLPQIYLTRDELAKGYDIIREARGEQGLPVVGVMLLTHHASKWQGRSWSINEATKFVVGLEEKGIPVIEMGKGTKITGEATLTLVNELDMRTLFSVIANLRGQHFKEDGRIHDIPDLFVTIDSVGLHIAQSFDIPTLALFGATEPIARVLNFEKIKIIRNFGLSCLGCYQRKANPIWNICEFGHEECMKGLSADLVLDCALGEIDTNLLNLDYLYRLARRAV